MIPMPRPSHVAVCTLSLLLAACGNIKVWPFDDSRAPERARARIDGTEYQCAGNKRFHVRYIENGAAAWVILPEREFRLEKQTAATGSRYSNGIAVLELKGDEVALSDGPAIALAGCKTPTSAP